MNNVRVHLLIYGDVTGVGFRFWAVGQASKLGLTGWVANVGREVEVVVEGEKENVENMIILCREGPPVAVVKRVDTKWGHYTGEFKRFGRTPK